MTINKVKQLDKARLLSDEQCALIADRMTDLESIGFNPSNITVKNFISVMAMQNDDIER